MGFSTIDYVVLLVYLAGITAFGMQFKKSHKSVKDYFVGARNTHWIIICLSIVATETSTLTLIGVPALAYGHFARPEQGGTLTYLQVLIGYVVGRFIIARLFLPSYFRGDLLTAYALLQLTPGGWHGVVEVASAAGKLQVFSFSTDVTVPFTFWAGVIGGTFLTNASHGTDQLLVQRLLTCKDLRDSQKAIITSGFIVLLQFVLFLGIGIMLFAYYRSVPQPAITTNDEIFPRFIVTTLPHGVSGLVIAAIFAAAMSNLSGSLNSLASTTVIDFYQPLAGGKVPDRR